MILTTGYNIDGYKITSYLNVISAEVVLGTGIFSALGSQFADFTGTRSGTYERKLESAKENALNELKKQANFLGANAIIGIDIDYTTFTSDILGVIVNGTAVYIEPDISIDSNYTYVPVLSYNNKLPFNICNVILSVDDTFQNRRAALEIRSFDESTRIKAIVVDVEFETVFKDKIELKDQTFAINKKTKELFYSTDFTKIESDRLRIDLINKAYIAVKKLLYFIDDEIVDTTGIGKTERSNISIRELESLRNNYGQDAVRNIKVNEDTWICYCGFENSRSVSECEKCHRKDNSIKKPTRLKDVALKGEIIDASISKETATEIYEYISGLNMPELENVVSELKVLMRKESLFDENQKEEAIETIVRML